MTSGDWIPILLFGGLLEFVGIRLNGNSQVFGIVKLGLILGGLILIGWAIFAAWGDLSNT